jgi:4-hydroxy-3-methylbut-2-enyl diphosphate reductase
VVNALRALTEVDVSTMEGREEHVEFRLPAELSEDLPAGHNVRWQGA